ncbi:MAG: peptidase S9, partial [Muribaculaceae bacterium]|nr:peptidase S9 [Muribaculaceae bacterium]
MLNKSHILAMTTLLMAASAPQAVAEEQPIIDRVEFKSPNRNFSIDALEALGRVSSPVVSPDGKKVLYGISYESVEQNKSNNDLYVMNIDGTAQQRLTQTPDSESTAVG